MSMKRTLKSLTVAVAVVTLAGASAAFATQAATAGKVKHLTGAVVSVNQDAKTLTVKRIVRQKEHRYILAVSNEAVATLSQLKPGEHVRVGYVETGGKMTAESIAVLPAANSAKAPVKTEAATGQK